MKAARAFEAGALRRVGIVAVVPRTEVVEARRLLAPLRQAAGGDGRRARRQDSVLEGLKQAPDGFDGVVLVHDAARPFAEREP